MEFHAVEWDMWIYGSVAQKKSNRKVKVLDKWLFKGRK